MPLGLGLGKILLRLATAIIALPLLFFAASLFGAMIKGESAALPAGTGVTIGLIRGPIHYDFLLPLTDDLRDAYGFAQDQGVPVFNPAAEWLLVGWGARRFYTSAGSLSDITAAPLIAAVTGDDAVMRLDVTGDLQDIDGIDYLPLSQAQYGALLQAIDASFQHDQTGAAIAIEAPGLGATDAFYAATGRFHIFNTCNVWVGQVLRAAGLPFGAWTPTPQAVALSLYWHHPQR